MISYILQTIPGVNIPGTTTDSNSDLSKELDSISILDIFQSKESLVKFLISLGISILVLSVFYALARFFERRTIKYIRNKAGDQQVLVANFFGKAVWVFVFGVGVTIAMFTLGLGEISGSLLGAAGITTFVVGFALKDIFENFLAGVIIAFDPPFILGSWIKVNEIEGVVKEMSLRQTMLKTFDGQDVFIPNSIILKTPLRNYTIDGYLRKDFIIGLDYGDDINEGLALIEKTLAKTKYILNSEGKKPEARVEEFATSTINVRCLFWVNTSSTNAPASKIVNNAMLNVLQVLSDAGHYLPADILEIKYYDPKAEQIDKESQLKTDLKKLKD